MTKAEVLSYRKLAWQLRQQHFEAKFNALLANNPAAATAAEVELAKINVYEDALNNIESAILQRELLNALPIPP